MNWPSSKLGQLAADSPGAIAIGPFGSSLTADLYTHTGLKVVRGQDIGPGRELEFVDPVFVGPETVSRLTRSVVRKGDLVLPHRGAIGRVGLVGNEPLMLSTSMMKITLDPSRCVPDFYLYFMRGPGKARLLEHSSVVGTPGIAQPLSALRSIDVPVPPVVEQRAIAEVLGALDDKIAANGTVCGAASDLMAALAAQLTGDSDPVPLTDLAESVKVQVTPGEMGEVRHYSLPAFDAGQVPASDSGSTIMSAKLRVNRPSVLLSRLNPRIPRVWDVPRVPDQPAVASTEFLVLEPKSISTGALWAVLSQPSTLNRLQGLARGTSGSHQRVKPEDAMTMHVPDARRFTDAQKETIGQLCLRRHAARLESVRLATLRDALLPHLMSGRISVREAGKAVEEVL